MWPRHLRTFTATLGLLTRIPVPAVPPVAAGAMLYWFAPCGLVVGLGGALAYWLGTLSGSTVLAAALGCTALLALSGGLHMDGLMDTADAIGSNADRPRMLEIMRDSRVGAFGVMAFVCTLLLKVAALSALEPARAAVVLVSAAVVGRAVQVALCCVGGYARDGGMGASFFHEARPAHVGFALAVAAPLALWGPGHALLLALGAGLSLLAARSVGRLLGGHTGDTLGASSEIAEWTVILLAGLCAGGG